MQSNQGATLHNVEVSEAAVSTPENILAPAVEQNSHDFDVTLSKTPSDLNESAVTTPADLPSVAVLSEVDRDQMLRRIIDSVADATLLAAAVAGINGPASMVNSQGVSHLGDSSTGDVNCLLPPSVASSDQVNNGCEQTSASDGPVSDLDTANIDDAYYSHLKPMIDKLPADFSAEQVAQVTDLLLRNADIFSRS